MPAALLVGALVVGGVLARGLDLLPGLPFGTETVDRSTPTLLTSLEDLERYHAATGSFQVVVDLEKDVRWVPSAISGERTTFLATGSVDAYVDFRGLHGRAVEVSDDGRSVTFSLPPAQLDEADVDLENSRVLARDRGVLDRVGGMFSDNPTSERQVASLAEDELDAAAAESDLREQAEENTREMLTGLARSLGFEDVVVEFDAADGA
ncbi:MAG: DUF4230 domain-containing protein [Actinomycetes bacterium]